MAGDPRFSAVYSPILTALLDHYATPPMAGRGPAGLERNSP